jgi:heme-degrading monooxygenase HmoA
MIKNLCTEIVEFKTVPGNKDEEFIKIVDDLEKDFHSKQSGFIDTELVKGDEKCQWIMIQHWESIEKAKESSKMMMKEPITEAFRQALDVRTVKLRYLNQVNLWSR